jgi:hypothetical protein
MDQATLDQHIKALTAKGWGFGVPIFHSGFDEFVADKGDIRIGGRSSLQEAVKGRPEGFQAAKVACVQAVLHYEKATRFSFINDPLRTVFRAAEELWPDIQFIIQYNHELSMDKNEFGCTLFPEDGSIPIIDINPALTVTAQLEIIGHEIAHVKAGEGAGHNEVWEGHFEEIFQKVMDIAHMEYEAAQGQTE